MRGGLVFGGCALKCELPEAHLSPFRCQNANLLGRAPWSAETLMQSSIRKVLTGTVVFLVSAIVGVVGYWLAGWSLLEAIYMVTITFYGVGYGEVRPVEDPALKLFTMGVIITGCTSSIYVVGGFIQMIAEGELNRVLGARRMTNGIEKLSGHVIVCGFGRVGRILAHELVEAQQSFVVIDTDQERLREAELSGLFVLIGDATNERVLESAGVCRAKVLASVLPDDAANVFITLTARELNPNVEIIARGQSPSTEKKLLRSGATRVVLPEAIGAARIARLITRPSAEYLLANATDQESLNEDLSQIGLRICEFKMPVNSPFVGQELSALSLGAANQSIVIAVRHEDESVTRNPVMTYLLRANDTLIVMAHGDAIPQLRQTVSRHEMVYRGARG